MLVFGIHCPFFLASPIQMEFSDVMIFSFLAKCARPKNQAHLRDFERPRAPDQLPRPDDQSDQNYFWPRPP